jgi:hypothetical protein
VLKVAHASRYAFRARRLHVDCRRFAAQPVSRAQAAPPADAQAARATRFDGAGPRARRGASSRRWGAADVLFIGETHDDGGAHLLEAELLRRAFERTPRGRREVAAHARPLARMFERDVQVVLDEYLAGLVSERHFWRRAAPVEHYQTDYRPLIEFARENGAAQSSPRKRPARYVSRVTRTAPVSGGPLARGEGVAAAAPRCPRVRRYASKFDASFAESLRDRGGGRPPAAAGRGHKPARRAPARARARAALHMLDAQTLRDASMAHAVAESLKRGGDRPPLVIHVNGTFHSEEGLGLPEQLKRYRARARALVVTVIPAANFDAGRMGRLGDFVVLTGNAAGVK